MRARPPLPDVIDAHKIIVVCGTGGVGKTTISAALALGAALRGKRALVLTIDPAKRLANALGIDGRLNEITPIDLDAIRHDEPEKIGHLDAMMLDSKSTWDEVVCRFSQDEETRDRILTNAYYQRAAGTLAGSQEYMAMEKLLQVHQSGDYDLIVLDTPPTRNALDFLEAPSRMIAVLQEGILRWLIPREGRFSSARAGIILFGKGQQALFRLFERFTGAEVLSGIAEFMGAFAQLLDGMRSRASDVLNLLRSDQVAFVLVASPRRLALAETSHFHERLSEGGVAVRGLVINRVRPPLALQDRADVPDAASEGLPKRSDDLEWNAMVDEVWTTYQNERARQLAEAQVAEELERQFGRGPAWVEVPEKEAAIHNLETLTMLLPHLQ